MVGKTKKRHTKRMHQFQIYLLIIKEKVKYDDLLPITFGVKFPKLE